MWKEWLWRTWSCTNAFLGVPESQTITAPRQIHSPHTERMLLISLNVCCLVMCLFDSRVLCTNLCLFGLVLGSRRCIGRLSLGKGASKYHACFSAESAVATYNCRCGLSHNRKPFCRHAILDHSEGALDVLRHRHGFCRLPCCETRPSTGFRGQESCNRPGHCSAV